MVWTFLEVLTSVVLLCHMSMSSDAKPSDDKPSDRRVRNALGEVERHFPVGQHPIDDNMSELLEVQQSVDQIIPLADYEPVHGHPHRNGKGHHMTKFNHMACVVVPAPRVWTIKRRRRQELKLTEEIDDGSEQFHEHQMQDNMNSLVENLFQNRGVGETINMDSLFGGGTTTSPPPSSRITEPLPSQSASSSSGAMSGFGISGLFDSAAYLPQGGEGVQHGAHGQPKSKAKAKAKATGKSKSPKDAASKNAATEGGAGKVKKTFFKKGLSRPKRCRMALVTEWISKLEESESKGPVWKEARTNVKMLEKLNADLTSEVEEVDTEEPGAEALKHSIRVKAKQVYASNKILSAYLTGGKYSNVPGELAFELVGFLSGRRGLPCLPVPSRANSNHEIGLTNHHSEVMRTCLYRAEGMGSTNCPPGGARGQLLKELPM